MSLWQKLRSALPLHRDGERGQGDQEIRSADRVDVSVKRPFREVASSSFPTPAQLEEDEEEFTLTVETPGFAKKDLEVSVSPDRIVIGGERVEEVGSRGGPDWTRSEGRLHIEVPLVGHVAQSKASAELKHGVLTVRVPKTEESRSRVHRVPVTSQRR